MTLKCIVHYRNQDCTYSKVKPIDCENMKRIIESKRIRESLGGDNHHEEQCLGVPDVIDPKIHGVRSVPCYKK